MEQKLTPTGTTLYLNTVDNKAPTVILIHNMWGSHKTMHRHVKFFNSLGLNTVTFNLVHGSILQDKVTFGGFDKFKFSYLLWVAQITDVLNFIDGPKYILSFSGPSLAGLIAAQGRQDILAYICDGGPFDHLWACTVRMFERETRVPTHLLRMIIVSLAVAQWGPFAMKHLRHKLNKWSAAVPILSIRGLKDPIVYSECIDEVFRPYPSLPLTVLELPEGQHLDGLKNFSEMYQKSICKFLQFQNF